MALHATLFVFLEKEEKTKASNRQKSSKDPMQRGLMATK
jgi:hypothetical protein